MTCYENNECWYLVWSLLSIPNVQRSKGCAEAVQSTQPVPISATAQHYRGLAIQGHSAAAESRSRGNRVHGAVFVPSLQDASFPGSADKFSVRNSDSSETTIFEKSMLPVVLAARNDSVRSKCLIQTLNCCKCYIHSKFTTHTSNATLILVFHAMQ